MELNIKAKLCSLQEIIDNRGEYCVDVEMDMLPYAGKTVTVLSYDEDDGVVTIKEDGANWSWDRAMFEGHIAEIPENLQVNLSDEIEGNHSADVIYNGNVQIGCQTVPFGDIEKLYKAAITQREKYTHLLPKKRKKRRKSKKRK